MPPATNASVPNATRPRIPRRGSMSSTGDSDFENEHRPTPPGDFDAPSHHRLVSEPSASSSASSRKPSIRALGKQRATGEDEWKDEDGAEDLSDGQVSIATATSNTASPGRRKMPARPVGLSKRTTSTPKKRRPPILGEVAHSRGQEAGSEAVSHSPLRQRKMTGSAAAPLSPGTSSSVSKRGRAGPRDDSGSKRDDATGYRYLVRAIDIFIRLLRICAIVLQTTISILHPLISLLLTVLSPLLFPLSIVLCGSAVIYFVGPFLASRTYSALLSLSTSTVFRLVSFLPSPFRLSFLELSDLAMDLAHSPTYGTLTAPFRYIAASSLCATTGALCEAAPASVAPIWAWSVWQRSWKPSIRLPGMEPRDRSRLDVGRMARGLSTEVRHARDIFESVAVLGEGDVRAGLDYLRVHELAASVGFSSQLDDREIISSELFELGNMVRDLSDHVMELDSAAVTSFRWIAWDFDVLLNTLPPPPVSDQDDEQTYSTDGSSRRPGRSGQLNALSLTPSQQTQLNRTLSTRIDALVSRLDEALSTILALTTKTYEVAELASKQSSSIHSALSRISRQLLNERALDPVWKHAVDVAKQRLTGGPIPRSEVIRSDITLTKHVLVHVEDIRVHLEGVRNAVKQYRNNVGVNKALMVGFHAVSGPENEGIEGWEEFKVLGMLVGGLVDAVDRAKGDRVGGGRSGRMRVVGGEGVARSHVHVAGPRKEEYE